MLELRSITKNYITGDTTVHALKGVSISFRESEFVSVLGPSGCGKTTMLNIIGGLDKATDGELVIEDVSTKKYTDRDWDTYRNHRIGFVFQSYNLIPHQTVLENVELALTIAGEEKSERVRRAKEALDKVGLGGLYNKKPNQLSGGQCQRVAIARALVGNPEILLADEPTGALDTETSVQIMDLVKEISKERLVIMVTHNPELAEKYSTRIVRLLDGEIIDDSDPYAPEPADEKDAEAAPLEETTAIVDGADGENPTASESSEELEKRRGKKRGEKEKKAKLSFLSGFRLSARNLLSKLKRTILVCFAGSIGIIGVATVLSVSSGVQSYIDKMQNDMLSGNPITVQRSAINLERLMAMADASTKTEAVTASVEDGKINVNYMIKFLAERSEDLSSLTISNDITQEYVDFLNAMPKDIYASLDYRYGIDMGNNIYTDYSFTGSEGDVMSLYAAQEKYTAILGKTSFADYAPLISMVAVNYSQAPSDLDFIASQYDIISEGGKIATEENELMLVVDKDTQLTDLLLAQLGYYNQDEFLNIAYKAKDNEDYDPALDKDRFDYSELLGKKFVWYPNDAVYTQNENPMTKALNPFFYNPIATDEFQNGIELKVSAILRPKENLAYGCMSSGVYYTPALGKRMLEDSASSKIVKYMTDGGVESIESRHVEAGNLKFDTGITYKYSFIYDGVAYEDNVAYVGKKSEMSAMMGAIGSQIPGFDAAGFADAFTLSLRNVGGNKLPSYISVYSTDFDKKDLVVEYLDRWNSDGAITVGDKTIAREDREDINYTDTLSIVINLVNNLITAITAALVAFTSLSLVVSTVMIAIITYVSVIERVKEIGVIRSLGGRKRDVSFLFTAETLIIGLISGVFGIFVTFILSLIINAVVNSFVAIGAIATLTAPIALIMIGVSVVLTLISGVAPARAAARKDPVVALRTE